MDNRISIGQLRQNPTEMIREVKRGATYTLTDRGEPVADIVPHRAPRWRSGAEASAVLAALGRDDQWAADLRELRDATPLTDPWAKE